MDNEDTGLEESLSQNTFVRVRLRDLLASQVSPDRPHSDQWLRKQPISWESQTVHLASA